MGPSGKEKPKCERNRNAQQKPHEHLESRVPEEFDEALGRRLKVMDATAFSLCRDNGLQIVVFKFGQPGILTAILQGDLSHATCVSDECGEP